MTLSNVTGGIFKILGHKYVRERVHVCVEGGVHVSLKVDLGGPWPLLH